MVILLNGNFQKTRHLTSTSEQQSERAVNTVIEKQENRGQQTAQLRNTGILPSNASGGIIILHFSTLSERKFRGNWQTVFARQQLSGDTEVATWR